MSQFEYKVMPAPRRGEKARGVKTTEDRFALAMSTLMNSLAADGWEYQRADTLPVDERSGLTGTKTSFHTMLVFRRSISAEAPVQMQRLQSVEPSAAAPRLGPAEAGDAGAAPAVGPATPVAAE